MRVCCNIAQVLVRLSTAHDCNKAEGCPAREKRHVVNHEPKKHLVCSPLWLQIIIKLKVWCSDKFSNLSVRLFYISLIILGCITVPHSAHRTFPAALEVPRATLVPAGHIHTSVLIIFTLGGPNTHTHTHGVTSFNSVFFANI
jgi:hypothetical protein